MTALLYKQQIGAIQDQENMMLALSDSYCRQILTSIADSPKTVREINDELGFSKNRIYRKLHLLKKNTSG